MVIKKDPPTGDGAPPFATDPVVDPVSAQAAPDADTAPAADTLDDEAPAAGTVAHAQARHAHTVIRNHVLLATASAVIPVAFLDAAALAAVQLRLLKELSDVYDVSFRADIGKSAIGTLLGTVAPTLLAGGVVGAMALRAIPVIGPVVRFGTQPLFHAAFTYALGKVFQQHFASGGTFLTFDPEKVKTYFRQKYDEARSRKSVVPDSVAA